MKKVFVSLSVAVLLLGLASCASTKNAVTLSSLNGEWNIIEVNGVVVVPAPRQTFPFIAFDTTTGKIYGNSGCNNLMGSFDLNAGPGSITLDALGSTRMACPDMTVENNLLAAFKRIKKYRNLGGGNMALCGSSNRPVLILQKKEVAAGVTVLDGKWLIREVSGKEIPKEMERQPFLEFNVSEKRLHGNAGCNIMNGSFLTNTEDPTALSFSQLACTMMACPDLEVEGRVLKSLDLVRSFKMLTEGELGLYDAEANLVMLLTKE